MNIEVKIVAPELAAALNTLAAAIAGRTGETTAPVQETVEPEKPKPARSAAKPSPKTEPFTPATDEAQQEPTPGETDQAEVKSDGASEAKADAGGEKLEYFHVKKAVASLSMAKGRDAVVELLAEFDVDHANKLTEDQFAGFIARADEIVGAVK